MFNIQRRPPTQGIQHAISPVDESHVRAPETCSKQQTSKQNRRLPASNIPTALPPHINKANTTPRPATVTMLPPCRSGEFAPPVALTIPPDVELEPDLPVGVVPVAVAPPFPVAVFVELAEFPPAPPVAEAFADVCFVPFVFGSG